MKTDTLHPLAASYLERLRRASRGLPSERRRELLAELEGHLSEAIDADASDAQALTVLDKLGDPEAIVAAEAPEADDRPPGRGVREWAAILLLLFGGFAVGVGWIAGLVLLWGSRAWRTREKLIGTLVVPGGLAVSVLIGLVAVGEPTKRICQGFAGQAPHCTNAAGQSASALGVLEFALLVLAPIASALFLAHRAAAS